MVQCFLFFCLASALASDTEMSIPKEHHPWLYSEGYSLFATCSNWTSFLRGAFPCFTVKDLTFNKHTYTHIYICNIHVHVAYSNFLSLYKNIFICI